MRFTRAKIDSALSLANSASVCAAEPTCTAYQQTRITFAGTLTSSFPHNVIHSYLQNTHVTPYVPLTEYAKSIQLRSQNLRPLEGT